MFIRKQKLMEIECRLEYLEDADETLSDILSRQVDILNTLVKSSKNSKKIKVKKTSTKAKKVKVTKKTK